MENSIFVALSRQMVLQDNMNIIANNVANMSTPGYKGQNLIFSEFVSDPRGQKEPISFVFDNGQYQVNEPGPIKVTNNPLDVAIEGPGFFGVIAPDGEVAYTRDGSFTLSADGSLITSAGLQVADAGGNPIVVPAGAADIKFDRNGAITTENGGLGQLMIVEFENLQALDPFGQNMYRTNAAAKPAPEETTVHQGVVEGSNVKPVVEMTRMIETLRTHQGVQRILQSENERLRTLIQSMTGQR